jgi:hypothetical protein
MDCRETQSLELTTPVYLGRLSGKEFLDLIYWCSNRLGSYGEHWQIDWENHMIMLDEKNAVLFALKWI